MKQLSFRSLSHPVYHNLVPNVLISDTMYASQTQAKMFYEQYKLWWTILPNFCNDILIVQQQLKNTIWYHSQGVSATLKPEVHYK